MSKEIKKNTFLFFKEEESESDFLTKYVWTETRDLTVVKFDLSVQRIIQETLN